MDDAEMAWMTGSSPVMTMERRLRPTENRFKCLSGLDSRFRGNDDGWFLWPRCLVVCLRLKFLASTAEVRPLTSATYPKNMSHDVALVNGCVHHTHSVRRTIVPPMHNVSSRTLPHNALAHKRKMAVGPIVQIAPTAQSAQRCPTACMRPAHNSK